MGVEFPCSYKIQNPTKALYTKLYSQISISGKYSSADSNKKVPFFYIAKHTRHSFSLLKLE